MEKVTMSVELVNGKFKVNGKELNQMNAIEREFLNFFFIELKRKDNEFLNK